MVLLEYGGVAMWPILVVVLISMAIFLERVFHLHRATLRGDGFVEGILRVLGQGNTFEAATLCEEAPGLFSLERLLGTQARGIGDHVPE